ncbi:interferon regulatory factor 4-like isoform X1 [Conger conger]|uniref:interferon regulatory factor 4-like isoform X1 n=1 Tax=Conger conger TaxID=82655 RepID=UPI002A5A67C2|nr:interferon regulatory factor 4-like isoform X1 [Conger conger]
MSPCTHSVACVLTDMNLESDYGTSVSCGNGKLRQWLIDQIDSGKYPGLVWENDDKTIFRIPWKHAGKQDYNRNEDAALFKAWALFKGKFREGIDKPDPPTWKTRLRCALNKSNDFHELVERSQLDISDPYKVYRIIPEGVKRAAKAMSLEEPAAQINPQGYSMHPPYAQLQTQVPGYLPHERREWRDYTPEPQNPAELPFGQCPYPPRNLPWQGLPCENGYQITGSFYTCSPNESQPSAFSLDPNLRSAEAMAFSDCRLHVSLFYRDSLVKEVTTTSQEGCRISTSPEDRLYGSMDQVVLPFPYPQSQRKGAEKLQTALERGVQLWLTPDGLYAKRLCQGRVFWEGPLAPFSDKPNKLEKEQTCKLFDTQQFLSELHSYAYQGRPPPKFQVVLCFGDEYPDPQRHSKLITAQVEPVFAKQLLYFAQQSGGHYGRGYETPKQLASPTEDYQRPVQHRPMQE